MDTSILEYTAEDLIAHKLQRAGILVAKPRFDQGGADLLAILQVRDGARFARVQCKGRTLLTDGRSEVVIKERYVSAGFVLFLFVETGQSNCTHLYCFFATDIRSRFHQRNDELVLTLRYNRFDDELRDLEATAHRIEALKRIIPTTDVDEEFGKVTFGKMHAVEEGRDSCAIVGTVKLG